MNNSTPIIISVFAGRVADTVIDPIPHMKDVKMLREFNANAVVG